MAAKKKPTPVAIPKGAKSDVIVKTVNDAVAAGLPVLVATEDDGQVLKTINDKVEFLVQRAMDLAPATAGAADAVAKAVETPVDAASPAPVVEGAELEKADGAKDVAAGGATEGETVGKADGAKADGELVAAPAGDAAVVVDPIAKATSALDKIDAAVASVAKPDDVQKSMYAVGRFAELLESLSYLASSAQSEADFEGDNSQVPAQLRDWLKSGAAIFKDMATEEVSEFVAQFKAMKKAADGDSITVDLAVTGEALAKAVSDVTTERDALVKSVADKDEALAKLADRIEPLAKTIEDLTKRITEIEAQPAGPKTAGPMAAVSVSKEQDAGGSGALEKTMPSQEDVAAALAEMSDEDRAMLLIKASRQLPRPVSYR